MHARTVTRAINVFRSDDSSELPLLVSQNDRVPHTDTFSGGDPVLGFTVCVYLEGGGEMLVRSRGGGGGGGGGGRGQRRVAIVPGRLVAFDNSRVTHSVVGDGGIRVMVGPMSLHPGTQRFEPVGGDADGIPDTCCGCCFVFCCCCCEGKCFEVDERSVVMTCPEFPQCPQYGNFDIVWNHFSRIS